MTRRNQPHDVCVRKIDRQLLRQFVTSAETSCASYLDGIDLITTNSSFSSLLDMLGLIVVSFIHTEPIKKDYVL